MWFLLALASAVLLGCYDVAKKQSLRSNTIMWVLFSTSLLSTIFLLPFLLKGGVGVHQMASGDQWRLLPKAALVAVTWISGLIGMKLLPLTTVSSIKATRPFFVVVFSLLIFGERLNAWQWAGVVLALTSLFLLSVSSKKEGIDFLKNKGIWWMGVSVVSGVCSALYDKHIMGWMDPLYVQSWTNFFITIFMAAVLVVQSVREGRKMERFHWDWNILLVSVLVTGADALYFFALSQESSLLSVTSLLRRCSVIVTFALGAILFKEKNVRAKSFDLAILLVAMALLTYGSSL